MAIQLKGIDEELREEYKSMSPEERALLLKPIVSMNADAILAECKGSIDQSVMLAHKLFADEWLLLGPDIGLKQIFVAKKLAQKGVRQNDHVTKRIEAIQTWKEQDRFVFGIQNLDQVTGGILPGEMLALTGAQGSMKTSLALKAVQIALENNKRVAFFSLDMSPQEIEERRLMHRLRCSQYELHQKIREDADSIYAVADEMRAETVDRFMLEGNDGQRKWTCKEMLEVCWLHRSQLLVIDYVTNLRESNESDLNCVERVIPMLKNTAQKESMAMILLNQMGRASKKEQAAGIMGGHGKGGGVIEESVHTEIELIKDYPLPGEEKDRIVATVTKNRRGPTRRSFDLDYDHGCMYFTGYCFETSRDASKQKPIFTERKSIY